MLGHTYSDETELRRSEHEKAIIIKKVAFIILKKIFWR
jgi:hypothetical protein